MNEIKKLLKATDVAKILNVSKPYAYRMMAEGKMPVVRMGSSVRVRKEDLEAFIQKNVVRQDNDMSIVPISFGRNL